MAKRQVDPNAAIVHAVFDFLYEDNPREQMAATFSFLKALRPELTDEKAQDETLIFFTGRSFKKWNEDAKKWLAGAREQMNTILKELYTGDMTLSFDDDTSFKVLGNRIHGIQGIALFDEVLLRIYDHNDVWSVKDRSDEGLSEIYVPRFFKLFLEALSRFPVDSVKTCDECGKYFFDERGYHRRFCSKKCNDRFSIRKSRAAKKGGKK